MPIQVIGILEHEWELSSGCWDWRDLEWLKISRYDGRCQIHSSTSTQWTGRLAVGGGGGHSLLWGSLRIDTMLVPIGGVSRFVGAVLSLLWTLAVLFFVLRCARRRCARYATPHPSRWLRACCDACRVLPLGALLRQQHEYTGWTVLFIILYPSFNPSQISIIYFLYYFYCSNFYNFLLLQLVYRYLAYLAYISFIFLRYNFLNSA